jgi:transposase
MAPYSLDLRKRVLRAWDSGAALSTLWRRIDQLGFTLKKKRYTPTNSAGLMSPRHGASGGPGSRCVTSANTYFSMNVA